jgi:16S rRNA (cytidine1402-2'-O)-methyltransferase
MPESLLLARILAAEIEKIHLKSGLYLVATPIGNMQDLTIRAIETLASCDVVACEDTRLSGQLFHRLGIKVKMIPYHDHNADTQRPKIIDMIAAGNSVALISDAGTPLISDPGYKLVRDCLEKNLYVTSLPGANAPLTALQLSGLPSDAFTFIGFLPSKTKARQDSLRTWKDSPSTLIVFESAQRLVDTCQDVLEVMGNRPMTLTRELTKKFEDIWPSDVQTILNRLEHEGLPKGEIVLVIGRNEAKEMDKPDIDSLLVQALKTMTVKDAVAAVVEATGMPKKEIYHKALEIKN